MSPTRLLSAVLHQALTMQFVAKSMTTISSPLLCSKLSTYALSIKVKILHGMATSLAPRLRRPSVTESIQLSTSKLLQTKLHAAYRSPTHLLLPKMLDLNLPLLLHYNKTQP
jgi:hypothetical protein